MGTGLKANIGRIQASADSFHRIHQEFSDSADPMAGCGVDVVGSQRLLDTFDTFESNWRIRRQELVDAMEKLGGITEMAAQAYSDINSGLIDALEGFDAQTATEAE
jgi:hypothetical protein